MFDNLRNLGNLLTQAGQIRQKVSELHQQLGRKTVQGEAGAGAVRVTMNGRFEVLAVRLDPVLIRSLTGPAAGSDQALVEELIAAAVNAAGAKARQLVQQEISRLTGGLSIPGLDQLVG